MPTIRRKCEGYAQQHQAPWIRINLREAASKHHGAVELATSAREALEAIDAALA